MSSSLMMMMDFLGPLFPEKLPQGVDLRAERGAMNGGLYLVRGIENRKVYAMKVVKRSSSAHREKQLQRELKALSQFARFPHPNILSMVVADKWPGDPQRMCIVTDFCDLGNLESVRRRSVDERRSRLPEPFIWHVFKSLAKALTYLHHGHNDYSTNTDNRKPQYFIHRDIKPANIFLQRDPDASKPYPRVILGDFGIAIGEREIDARPSATRHHHESGGTPNYMPPEYWKQNRLYRRRSDVWQVSAVITELLGIQRFGPDPTGKKVMILEPDLSSAGVNYELIVCIEKARNPNMDKRCDAKMLLTNVSTLLKQLKFRGAWPLPPPPLAAWHFTDSAPQRERMGYAGVGNPFGFPSSTLQYQQSERPRFDTYRAPPSDFSSRSASSLSSSSLSSDSGRGRIQRSHADPVRRVWVRRAPSAGPARHASRHCRDDKKDDKKGDKKGDKRGDKKHDKKDDKKGRKRDDSRHRKRDGSRDRRRGIFG